MRVIRAMRGIHVPHNPENPDKNAMRLVQKNLVALVPEDFKLPDDAYVDLGKFYVKSKDKNKNQD